MAYEEHEQQAPEEHLVRQIGFAERWLARAKREVTAGQTARSVLTLLLAEAEVHHARERTLPAREAVLPRPSMMTTILGATALVALTLAGWLLLSPKGEMVSGFSSAPAVVQLRQPGSTLALVPAVLMPEPAVAAPAPHASQAPSRLNRMWQHTARPAPSRPAIKTRPAAPAAVAPVPSVVSDGDLIDLVIAAERSLRGGTR